MNIHSKIQTHTYAITQAPVVTSTIKELSDDDAQRKLDLRVRGEQAFDWLTLGPSLGISNRNRTVTKVNSRLVLSHQGVSVCVCV